MHCPSENNKTLQYLNVDLGGAGPGAEPVRPGHEQEEEEEEDDQDVVPDRLLFARHGLVMVMGGGGGESGEVGRKKKMKALCLCCVSRAPGVGRDEAPAHVKPLWL